MPVYNEEDSLDEILHTIKKIGYLHKITIVNDASTDSSKEILERWYYDEGLKIIHLDKNHKKEGAIREIMLQEKENNTLADYTVILDADSFIEPPENISVDTLLQESIDHMKKHTIAGMAFRINAIVPRGWSLLEKCIYSDYAGMQFDNAITSRQHQLWVINGPGGIFHSEKLLEALDEITLDFETGDLAITLRLMQKKEKVEFYSQVDVFTKVPSTYKEYFNQRRRWERGTIKVLHRERSFYNQLLYRWKWLSLMLFIYILFHLGVLLLPIFLLVIWDNPSEYLLKSIIFNYLFWTLITSLKTLYIPHKENTGKIQVVSWAFMNGILFLTATGIARVIGFWEAIYSLVKNRRK